MTDDLSEIRNIASDKEGVFGSNDGQTEMEHNSPVDCLRNHSGQISTEPGGNDIGAKAAISFLSKRLVRIRGSGVSLFFVEKEYKKRNCTDIRTSTPEGDGWERYVLVKRSPIRRNLFATMKDLRVVFLFFL